MGKCQLQRLDAVYWHNIQPLASPVDSTHTHRTRFAQSINIATGKLKSLQVFAGITNSYNFGMSRRVNIY
jgi:hypothetical protein